MLIRMHSRVVGLKFNRRSFQKTISPNSLTFENFMKEKCLHNKHTDDMQLEFKKVSKVSKIMCLWKENTLSSQELNNEERIDCSLCFSKEQCQSQRLAGYYLT